jgi:PIN domain nuclease of toxin-antitoxin system
LARRAPKAEFKYLYRYAIGPRALSVPGIHFVPLDAAAAAESTLLPGKPHGDPANRFLIATARTQGVALATRDEHIIEYGKLGFLRVVAL